MKLADSSNEIFERAMFQLSKKQSLKPVISSYQSRAEVYIKAERYKYACYTVSCLICRHALLRRAT